MCKYHECDKKENYVAHGVVHDNLSSVEKMMNLMPCSTREKAFRCSTW
jgi:hypothetical protein